MANPLNIGPGNNKIRLVTDLDAAYKNLNTTLTKTASLSKQIANDLKGASGRGSTNAADIMSGSGSGSGGPFGGMLGGVPSPPSPPTPGNGGSKDPFTYGHALSIMAGAAVTALAQGVDSQNYIQNMVSTSRMGFFGGTGSMQNGGINAMYGGMISQNMMNKGTPTSVLDAANAAMTGNSAGLMTGLRNYGTIMNSAAGVSNVLPGAGLEGGMNAVSALNQGSSVNKLRMIGIQVRDSKGYMRDIESIARDLWRNLNNSKNGTATISAQDLSYSLQSGNSLDMLMNQYFGSDAVLRQSVTSYLFQFAQEKGAPAGGYTSSAGKTALSKSGANADISQSIGTRYATGYANTQAYTSAGTNGVQMANGVIQALTAATTAISSVAAPLVATTTFMQTLAGAGNGAGGALIGGAVKTFSGVIDAASGAANAAANVGLGAAVAPEIAASPEILIGLAAAGILAAVGGAIGTDITNNVNANNLQKFLKANGMNDANTITNSYGVGNQPAFGGALTGRGTSSTGSTGSKTTGQIKDKSGWAGKLLDQLKIKKTPTNIASLTAWATKENGVNNNVLGITQSSNGASALSSFATEDAGISATAKFLQMPKYKNILDDLSNGSTQGETWAAIAASPWNGDNHYGTNKVGNTAAKYYGQGHTVNINITGADLKNSNQLAKDITAQIDAYFTKQQVTGSAGRTGVSGIG